jgi:plasmid stabilization system protein ParE
VRVVFAPLALQALERIADYIAQDNPRRAISFVRELQAKALGIGRSPRAFPLVPRYEAHGVRRRVHGRYLIFYRIDADAVVVLHILHGAQDMDRALFPDG